MWRAVLTVGLVSTQALAQRPPASDYQGKAWTFTRVAEGVYHAVGIGALVVGSNAAVIVNDKDVILVDSHVSPAAAWSMMHELEAITPKPVRAVINTHFHFDHVDGNQVYGPDVEIIGHEFTRAQILAGMTKRGVAYDGLIRMLDQQDDSLRTLIRTTKDGKTKATATQALRDANRYRAGVNDAKPTPPTMTLSHELTLHRGAREIRILFFGRGHTGGDVVVYLPAERVLISGDLVTGGLPFLGDGYISEWGQTLEHLNSLDFDVILPGHGIAIRDRVAIKRLQSFLGDFSQQATALFDAGVNLADAERRLDLRAHAMAFPVLADRTNPATRDRLMVGLSRIKALREERP